MFHVKHGQPGRGGELLYEPGARVDEFLGARRFLGVAGPVGPARTGELAGTVHGVGAREFKETVSLRAGLAEDDSVGAVLWTRERNA